MGAVRRAARRLLRLVVLQNVPATRAGELLGLRPALVVQRLVEVLDLLADHFELRERRAAQ
jgi:hypothetical protein